MLPRFALALYPPWKPLKIKQVLFLMVWQLIKIKYFGFWLGGWNVN